MGENPLNPSFYNILISRIYRSSNNSKKKKPLMIGFNNGEKIGIDNSFKKVYEWLTNIQQKSGKSNQSH